MTSSDTTDGKTQSETVPPGDDDQIEARTAEKSLTPAARRALAEAEERRRRADSEMKTHEKEVGGRKGPDPVRYGDWEKGGIISDF